MNEKQKESPDLHKNIHDESVCATFGKSKVAIAMTEISQRNGSFASVCKLYNRFIPLIVDLERSNLLTSHKVRMLGYIRQDFLSTADYYSEWLGEAASYLRNIVMTRIKIAERKINT